MFFHADAPGVKSSVRAFHSRHLRFHPVTRGYLVFAHHFSPSRPFSSISGILNFACYDFALGFPILGAVVRTTQDRPDEPKPYVQMNKEEQWQITLAPTPSCPTFVRMAC